MGETMQGCGGRAFNNERIFAAFSKKTQLQNQFSQKKYFGDYRTNFKLINHG